MIAPLDLAHQGRTCTQQEWNWLMKTDEAQLEIYPLDWRGPSNYATLYVREYPR